MDKFITDTEKELIERLQYDCQDYGMIKDFVKSKLQEAWIAGMEEAMKRGFDLNRTIKDILKQQLIEKIEAEKCICPESDKYKGFNEGLNKTCNIIKEN